MLQAQNNWLNINNLRQHNSDHRKLWAAASDVSCAWPPPKLRNSMRLMQSTSRTTTCILSLSLTQTKWLQRACERATDRDLGAMDGPIIISPPPYHHTRCSATQQCSMFVTHSIHSPSPSAPPLHPFSSLPPLLTSRPRHFTASA